MKKKKLLIISYSYPPANVPAAQRPYSIAKYLDKDKFDVTVLTCGNQDSSLGFDTSFNEELDHVNLIKVNGYKVSKNRAIATTASNNNQAIGFKTKLKQLLMRILSPFVFPDKGVFWYPKVKKFIKVNKTNLNFDIIFSTSPMFTNHLLAKKVKKINPKASLVADFRDFHYLGTQQPKKGLKSYLNKKLESNCIKNSDEVCFISEAMKNEYANYYSAFKNKFHAIYNGFDIDEYDTTTTPIKSRKLSIFYAGSFYKGVRNPMPLLNILETLINQKIITPNDIKIEIAGNFESELVDEIKSLKIFKSIVFLGLLPRNEVLKKYKQSHLLWLIVGNKVSHYTGVPIKFYEYLASQRPMINFAPSNSEPTKIIDELNLGWSFDTNNFNLQKETSNFKNILINFRKGELKQNLALKNTTKYSRRNQTKQLEKIFLNA